LQLRGKKYDDSRIYSNLRQGDAAVAAAAVQADTFSWSVSPFLYLIAFGYALGRDVVIDGHTYMEFLIPGLAAMSSMTQAFVIASEINVARFYLHIFEEFQSAPISNSAEM